MLYDIVYHWSAVEKLNGQPHTIHTLCYTEFTFPTRSEAQVTCLLY
jgi:hypothetical protein